MTRRVSRPAVSRFEGDIRVDGSSGGFRAGGERGVSAAEEGRGRFEGSGGLYVELVLENYVGHNLRFCELTRCVVNLRVEH